MFGGVRTGRFQQSFFVKKKRGNSLAAPTFVFVSTYWGGTLLPAPVPGVVVGTPVPV